VRASPFPFSSSFLPPMHYEPSRWHPHPSSSHQATLSSPLLYFVKLTPPLPLPPTSFSTWGKKAPARHQRTARACTFLFPHPPSSALPPPRYPFPPSLFYCGVTTCQISISPPPSSNATKNHSRGIDVLGPVWLEYILFIIVIWYYVCRRVQQN